MKKILVRVYFVLLFLCFISLIVLSILGSKSRVGYLEILSLNENDSYSNNYIYNFQIKYYDKVFRNSDIYGVYLNTNSLPDYVKEIKMNDNLGTPFGTLISSKEITENKIDNVKYTLKIKISIFLLFILLILLFAIFVYISDLFVLFLFIFLILFNISVNVIFIVFILLVLLLFIRKSKSLSNIKMYYIIIVVFTIFLILPSIVYSIFGNYFDKTNYENRLKAEKPSLDIMKLDEYPKLYESYFNDYIAFRNELIQKKVYFDLVLFNNFVNTRHTLIGKEDWLFMKWNPIVEQYIGKYMFTDNELEIAKQNLIDFRDKLRDKNIDLVVMIIPEKSMVYDNYLPDYIQKMKYSTNITDQLIQYINNNTDIKIVYPRDELIKYRDKYQLYYKYDDHWNNLGGYIGYSELMKSININLLSIDKFDTYKTGYDDINEITGIWDDLIWLINLPPTKKYNNQYNYYISNFITNDYKIIEGKRGPHESLSCVSDSFDKRHITIFRDSYTCAMFDYLASSFYETTFIYNGHIKNESIPADTDVVFFTFVERAIKDMFLYSIKYIKID